VGRLEFEPFGQRLALNDEAGRGGRASGWPLWVGSAGLWSLAAAIVLASALFSARAHSPLWPTRRAHPKVWRVS